MLFAELSADVIAIFAQYDGGAVLFKLLQCGNMLLSARIRQISAEVTIEFQSPICSFPFSVFTLPLLKSLCVSQPLSVPFKLGDTLILPAAPLLSLTSLTFEFPQSFSILRFENGTSVIETLLPHLTSLRLRGSTKFLTYEQFRAVPKRYLVELELSCQPLFDDDVAGNSHSYKHLIGISPTLEKLKLPSIIWAPDPVTQNYQELTWPAGLRSLEICVSSASIFDNLPKVLQKMKLDTFIPEGVEVVPIRSLPRSLEALTIRDLSSGGVVFDPDHDLSSYPPNLKYLDVHLKHSKVDDLAGLPTSLTSFPTKFLSSLSEEVIYRDWLPQLTEATVNNQATVAFLSPRLETLHLTSPLSESTPPLPEPLKRLHCAISESRFLSQLSSLKNLTCLQFMTLTRWSPSFQWSSDDAARLPQSLRKLSTNAALFKTIDSLRCLPTSLESLELEFTTHSPLNQDLDLPHALPSRITSLGIFSQGETIFWREWLSNLGHLKYLKNLKCVSDSESEYEHSGRLDFFKSLPKSLKALSVLIGTDLDEDETYLHSLPPTLTSISIHLYNGTEIRGRITNKCLEHLPHTLTALRVGDFDGLTPAVLPLLPPFISTLELSLPEDASYQDDRHPIGEYWNLPHWEGYHYWIYSPVAYPVWPAA
jgi:hypothetical protein